jgi:hypothetical protein
METVVFLVIQAPSILERPTLNQFHGTVGSVLVEINSSKNSSSSQNGKWGSTARRKRRGRAYIVKGTMLLQFKQSGRRESIGNYKLYKPFEIAAQQAKNS